MHHKHKKISAILAVCGVLAMVAVVAEHSSEAKAVEVDTIAPVEQLQGYGTLTACSRGETVTLLATGPDSSHRVFWTCSGSRGVVRYAKIA